MKKIFLILAVSFLAVTTSTAQKFAYVDTDYILNKIPEFKQAQDKLDAISSDWQKDIENKYADVEQMYRAYQQEQVLLTDEMKTK
ncbi:MAG: OmpH family outer membrane protein, partial [Flavobacteriales bacterium]|nr:OmpH family outer membrane protein [Flavobacteriales bacterium]